MLAKIDHLIRTDTFKTELDTIKTALTKSAEADKIELYSKIETIKNDIIAKSDEKIQASKIELK